MPLELEPPKTFSVGEDPASVGTRWKLWKRSFTFFIESQDQLEEARKANILMHCAGPEVQEILSTFPVQPVKTLTAYLTALDAYFLPKTNKRYERFLFDLAIQESTETVDSYVTRLRKLAESCEFADSSDRIVDKVISKCHSSQLRKKLLEQDDLDLDKVLKIDKEQDGEKREKKVIQIDLKRNRKDRDMDMDRERQT